MIPTRIGQKYEGGHFTGVIRVGNSAYAVIVAPKSTQVIGLPFKTSADATANTQSVNDGWANTTSMNDSSHPAAQYCCNITTGGYTDWYLPSCDELELCYRYLKPTADTNTVYTAGNCSSFKSILGIENGTNSNSDPKGTAYTRTNITRTIVTAFCADGVEAFDTDSYYWTSTEYSFRTSSAMFQNFSVGYQTNANKTYTGYLVRAVRRVLIA